MARDLMHDIMEQVIEEVVVEDIRNRVPDEKLDEKLSQDNISRAYKPANEAVKNFVSMGKNLF